MDRNRATLIGFLAILMWSALAFLTVETAPMPPFQLAALTFGLAALAALVVLGLSARLGDLRQATLRGVAFATCGLFFYHALYFQALRLAPPEKAGLVAYLWPLLIVLLSGLVLRQGLSPRHVVGAAMGFAGTAVLVLSKGTSGLTSGAGLGLVLAFACALVWSLYSVLSRRFADAGSASLTLACAMTAILSVILHLGTETTAWPVNLGGWAAILALGLGPVGLAFFAWDHGMKHGDMRLLGVLSYAAPVLSTGLLILSGKAEAAPALAVATALVVGGALLAASVPASRPITKS